MKNRSTWSVALLSGAIFLSSCASTPDTPQAQRNDMADAQSRVIKAAAVVDQMKSDHAIAALLRQARGLLVIPDYGKAAWIIGGQGGVGVLLARYQGRWSGPAFFTIGGVSSACRQAARWAQWPIC